MGYKIFIVEGLYEYLFYDFMCGKLDIFVGVSCSLFEGIEIKEEFIFIEFIVLLMLWSYLLVNKDDLVVDMLLMYFWILFRIFLFLWKIYEVLF